MNSNNLDAVLGVADSSTTSNAADETVSEVASKPATKSTKNVSKSKSSASTDSSKSTKPAKSSSKSEDTNGTALSDPAASTDAANSSKVVNPENSKCGQVKPITLNGVVALYSHPSPVNAIATVSGTVYVRGDVVQGFLPVSCPIKGVGRLDGYICASYMKG